ncbi:S8 family peptidase [Streptomyces europaeiscabiei]|uniref:S8 family peptidase n=1 Tax=Streptomyces europaeiscabiei TaxID=146819 RepID=UPI0029BAE99E|nr:S8 family peptidase [Streptomyces europaeiscabiei]MDX3634520.1 S8 family peptidase [Streptomyces europaeiscabiei]MDX3654922.1 S8 family peptidase [Streptomyces europaeiscabiei]WUD33271.1 S8 family peptidase [Streptomyces europaeiscabiei]
MFVQHSPAPHTPGRRRRGALVAMMSAAALFTVGAATAAPAVAAPAEGQIVGANAENAIKGSYIVTLKESLPFKAASSKGKAVATRYGAVVEQTYKKALNGYATEMTEAEAKQLAADPAVAGVATNKTVHMSDTQTGATWGLDRIDQADLPLDSSYTYPSSAGSGVTAYIIDTGVRITHTDFGGRASYGYDAVDDDSSADDGNGHGTHVAGTVAGTTYGVAKAADIVAVRVLDDEGSGTTAGVVAGIDWVTDNAQFPAVANMSLGGSADSTLDTAVANSIAAGITYAVAAGNDGANASSYSPARVASAITVGASTSADARASYSNYGSALDIFAPGSSITSTYNTSNSATASLSGTSMASPHVAGAAAVYLGENPSATPSAVTTALTSAASASTLTGVGTGSPNLLLQVTPSGDGDDGGDDGGDTGTAFESTTDVSVPDAGSAVYSPITVSGLTGSAPSDLSVYVNIVHTYRGDLVIDLVAPDGSTYRLKSSSSSDSTDNVDATYTVDASSETTVNGSWQLKVQDVYSADTGYINSWKLTF